MFSCFRGYALALVEPLSAAADHYGQVTFCRAAGARRDASPRRSGETRARRSPISRASIASPICRRPWTLQVEMLGFSTLRQEFVVSPSAQPLVLTLTLLPFDTIVAQRCAAVGGDERSARGCRASDCRRGLAVSASQRQRSLRRYRRRRGCRGSRLGFGSVGRCRRRLPDQRQRQQRRRVAVRAARGVRQQPAQRAIALQRRPRRPARQLGLGRAPVLVHRPARRPSRATTTCRSSARSPAR